MVGGACAAARAGGAWSLIPYTASACTQCKCVFVLIGDGGDMFKTVRDGERVSTKREETQRSYRRTSFEFINFRRRCRAAWCAQRATEDIM